MDAAPLGWPATPAASPLPLWARGLADEPTWIEVRIRAAFGIQADANPVALRRALGFTHLLRGAITRRLRDVDTAVIEAVLPGVNVPLNQDLGVSLTAMLPLLPVRMGASYHELVFTLHTQGAPLVELSGPIQRAWLPRGEYMVGDFAMEVQLLPGVYTIHPTWGALGGRLVPRGRGALPLLGWAEIEILCAKEYLRDQLRVWAEGIFRVMPLEAWGNVLRA